MAANDSEEQDLIRKGYKHVAGVDESAMGSFAGDVYVAVVIFPPGIDYKTLLPGLNDSKKKTPEQRAVLYGLIKKHALAYQVETSPVAEIDDINVYWARFAAVNRALDRMAIKPDYLLMDGNKEIPNTKIPQHAIVKGDSKSMSIAAASILAKVDRDTHIEALAKLVHEDYEWADNKSYYSVQHVKAIKKHGKTQYHRHKYVVKYLTSEQKEETW